jgi:hypothetical protein
MNKNEKIEIIKQKIKQIEIEIFNFDFKHEEDIQLFNELNDVKKEEINVFINNKTLALNIFKGILSDLEINNAEEYL